MMIPLSQLHHIKTILYSSIIFLALCLIAYFPI